MPRGRAKGYANRTDLQSGKPLPVQTPTGMQYGQGKALQDAQRAVPMAGTSAPKPSPAAPVSNVGQPLPTVPLTAPTQRPNEPIMAGSGVPTEQNDMQQFKTAYMSYFENALRYDSVPQQFSDFVSWLRSQ